MTSSMRSKPIGKLLDRRTVLRGAAGAAVALPVLDAMMPLTGIRRAHAAVTPPRRLITMFSGNGWVMNNWKCKPTSETNFELSRILAPFAPIKDKCLFIEGVPNLGAYEGSKSGHPGGNVSVLTGSWVGPGSEYAGGDQIGGPPFASTIEYLLGKEVGASTKFPSYHFGAVSSPARIMSRAFYAHDSGTQARYINPNFDPYNVYDQMFTGLPMPGTGTPMPDPAAERKVARQRSVLNDVMEDLRSLRCRLGADDRRKVDQHLTHVTDVEKRLGIGGSVVPTAGCKAPTLDRTNKVDLARFDNLPTLSRLQLDLLASALACDLTRSVGFQWHRSDTDNNAVMTWLGHDDSHHDISHLRGGNPMEHLTTGSIWFAKEIMYLVDKLKQIPEGDGTVFDNTVILWVTEQGNGWEHRYTDVPFNIIGTGGHFRGGRYLKFGGGQDVPHHRLLLSLMQYMGSKATTVGGPMAAKFCTGGPLSGLT